MPIDGDFHSPSQQSFMRPGRALDAAGAVRVFPTNRDAQALAVITALRATVGRTAADAATRLHGIDPELPGFMALGGV